MPELYSAVYGSVHYNEPFKSFDFGLTSVANIIMIVQKLT